MVARHAFRKPALLALASLFIPLLFQAGGCAGERPTFGPWKERGTDAGDASKGDASIPGDGTHSRPAEPVTALEGTEGSRMDGAVNKADSGSASTNSGAAFPKNDAGIAQTIGASDADADALRDGSAVEQDTTSDVTTALPDAAVDHACSQTIAAGVSLGGTSRTLLSSSGTPIGQIAVSYLPEPGLYAFVFERGLSNTGLSLATVDERGNVIREATVVTSPLLDNSRFDQTPKLAWNGQVLGLLLRGDDSENNQYLFGLTLELDGSVSTERQWPAQTAPDMGFELSAYKEAFIGIWHVADGSETLSVVQRLDSQLQPVGSVWQPLAAEPWLPGIALRGHELALTRGTREEAQLHVLSESLDAVELGSVDEPNSGTPLVVGTSTGYALAWNRSNQQLRFAKYASDRGSPECGPVLLSEEPRNLAAFAAIEGGYLALTATDTYRKHVEWLAVSHGCVAGPATSITRDSVVVPAAAAGASTIAVAWVELEQNTYNLKYAVMSNSLCQ